MILLLATPASAEDLLPPGDFVRQAVALEIRQNLLDGLIEPFVADITPTLTIGSTPWQEVADVWLCSQDVQVQNLQMHFDLDVAELRADHDAIRFVLQGILQINQPWDPAWVVLSGCLDDACALWSDEAQIFVHVPITLDLIPGGVDVQMGPVEQNLADVLLYGMNLGSCGLTSINAWFFENLGINLYTWVLQEAAGRIDVAIAEELAGLELDLEDGLEALWIEEEVELLDSALTLRLEPTGIHHEDGSFGLVLGGSADAGPPDPCVAGLDPGGSPLTDTPLPPLWPTDRHLRVLLGDELPNQALYAAWASGLLCLEVDSLGDDPLTAGMLGLLLPVEAREPLAELLGTAPIVVRTVPNQVPRLRFDGPHDLLIEARELDLEFWSTIDHREVRLWAVTIDVVIRADLGLDPTGALAVSVDVVDSELAPSLTYGEIEPELGQTLAENFDALVDLALGAVAGDFLGDRTLALPTFGGQGLVKLYITPDGDQLDFLSLDAAIGPSDGGVGTGCDDAGCADLGGCAGDDLGCAGEAGACDATTLLLELGCSGTASDAPDQGCSGRLVEGACSVGTLRVPTSATLPLVLLLLARRRRR